MNDLLPLNVPALLRALGLNPKKSLGQNFLVDESYLQRIAEAAEIPAGGEVLEIGPGLGSLTRHLARAAGRVVAVELDRNLIPVLQEVLSHYSNVEIIQGDILKQDPMRFGFRQGFRVAANIPYYITSAVIRHLLEAEMKPACMVLTMQKEVAARICAMPGQMSLLALSVQVYGYPVPVLHLPAGAFHPAPSVDSTVLKMEIFAEPRIPSERMESFFKLAKAGFSQKRKTLRNSLSGGLGWKADRCEQLLADANINPMRRAETLSIEEWGKLTEIFSAE